MLNGISYSAIESKNFNMHVHRAHISGEISLEDVKYYIQNNEVDILRLALPTAQHALGNALSLLNCRCEYVYSILRYQYYCSELLAYSFNFKVRRAHTEDDLSAIRAILSDSFSDQPLGYSKSTYLSGKISIISEMKAMLEYYESFIYADTKRIYIIYDGANAIGCVSEETYPENTVQNSLFGLHKAYQSKGIYTEALKKYFHILRSQKIQKMLIGVREDNYAARKVYSKFNFQQYDIEKIYLIFPNQ